MASGYSINGGVSRCFPFWQDLLSCYIVNTTADSNIGKYKCLRERDDYLECLHHDKEIAKETKLSEIYTKAKQGYRVTGEVQKVVPLGLLKAQIHDRAEELAGHTKGK